MTDAAATLAIGVLALVGLGLLASLVVWLWAVTRPLPATRGSLPTERDRARTEALLTFPEWRKRELEVGAPRHFERPLEIQDEVVPLPEDGLLPPPRAVQGHNGEA